MQPHTLHFQETGPQSSQPAGFSGVLNVPHGPQISQQAQESLFLEELTLRLNQMGPNSSSQDCIRKLKSLNLDDHFWMFIFKVAPCTRTYAHKWTLCPCAHAGETARRRDPRTSSYKAVLCPLVKAKKVCPLGDACSYSHNVFEHWLHPSRYKTRLCSFGSSCNRSICFFAHTTEELRCVPNMDDGKEVDEREFLMQLMMMQENRLLTHEQVAQQQPQQQQQQPHQQQQQQMQGSMQHPHPPPHSPQQQQLPVLYTMAPEALQQPMQLIAQPLRSSHSGNTGSGNFSGGDAGAARRHAPQRSLTGIPLSYRQNLAHSHGGLSSHISAVNTPFHEVPSRMHPHSISGPHTTLPPADPGYLSMNSLQETLAGLGLGGGPPSHGHLSHSAAQGVGHSNMGPCSVSGSCDALYADAAAPAAMLHGLQAVPLLGHSASFHHPTGPRSSSNCMVPGPRMGTTRISDPGMHALLSEGRAGSSDEEGFDDFNHTFGAGPSRISDSGKPLTGLGQGHLVPPKELAESLRNLLPLMNFAQKQQQQQQQQSSMMQGLDVSATYPSMIQGPSSSPPASSLASSGSARSSSPPTSYETNATTQCAATLLAGTPASCCLPHSSPPTLGSPTVAPVKPAAAVSLQSPQHHQQQVQHQLKQEDLHALAASAGQAAGGVSTSYVNKIVADLHEQGLAGSKEQLVVSLSQLLAQLLSAP